jgi:hypothetical protein
MATPFEIVIEKLDELGFYEFFFPFVITAAIFYALLRKTRVFGENPTTAGVLAISISFLVFSFPALAGLSLQTQFSTFFTQATIFILIFVVAVVLAGVFYPDITKVLMEQFKKPLMFYIMIAIGIVIFLTSGLISIFTDIGNPLVTGQEPDRPFAPTEVFIIVAAVIVFLIIIIVAAGAFAGGGGK